MTDLSSHPTLVASSWLADFSTALGSGDVDAAVALFERRQLLARPGRLHLEHPDPGRARGDPRDAEGASGRHPPDRVRDRRRGDRGRRRGRSLVHLRDRRRARPRPPAPAGRQGLDAADHDDRAEGLRGAHRRRAASRAPSTACRSGPQDVAGAAPGGIGDARLQRAALCRDHRRRPGRHRARRAAAPARRADHHRREERAARRLLAQALQEPVPARSGLVRPPALPAVPGRLAGVLAEGQDRRLARDVHEGDGAQLLELHHREEGALRRREAGVGASSSSATAGRSRCGRSSSCSRSASRATRTCRRSPAPRASKASSTTPASTRGPRPTAARSAWCSAPTTRPTTSAPRSGSTAPTSP